MLSQQGETSTYLLSRMLILIAAGLHDPRVGYWEPAKYVAKLREYKTDSNMLLFKCEMGAGEQCLHQHSGPMAVTLTRQHFSVVQTIFFVCHPL